MAGGIVHYKHKKNSSFTIFYEKIILGISCESPFLCVTHLMLLQYLGQYDKQRINSNI